MDDGVDFAASSDFEARLQRLEDLAARLESSVQALRQEVGELRRVQEEGLGPALAGLLPEGSPPPDSLEDAPGLGAVRAVRLALQEAVGALGPEEEALAARLEEVLGLERALEREEEWEERAGALLRLLERRLLAGERPDGLAGRQVRFLLTDIPEMLSRAADLAGADLDPARRQALEALASRVEEALGLEEIRPRRGDPYRGTEHNLLRAVPGDDPGLENRVASCHAPGLRVRATGRLIRKADVSVYV